MTALSLPMYTMAMTAQEKPDILWILTDDHRADALECFNIATRGTKESRLGYVSSPALNKLASEGVLFTASYCNSPGSAPSRASMHTGLYPHHRGVYGFEYFHVHPDFNPVTMPEYLSKAGYNTTGFGKLGVRSRIKNKSGKDSNLIMYDTFSIQRILKQTDILTGQPKKYGRVKIPEENIYSSIPTEAGMSIIPTEKIPN